MQYSVECFSASDVLYIVGTGVMAFQAVLLCSDGCRVPQGGLSTCNSILDAFRTATHSSSTCAHYACTG
jgi:hypothetical protein